MKRYTIEHYKSFPMADFYTVRLEGSQYNETDTFFLRFMNQKRFAKDVETIKYYIEKIGREFGAQERFFRPEKKACALPIPPPKSALRLYCVRLSEQVVILGNGGEKTSQKVHDSPDVLPHFKLMNDVATEVRFKLEKGIITREGRRLEGVLTLTIDI